MQNMNSVPTPVARVIIENDRGSILFLKRTDEKTKDTWCLPGGHVEQHENPEDTARREVLEETGLEVTHISLVYKKIDDFYGQTWLVHYYVAKIRGNITINNESSDFAWIAPADYSNYNMTHGNEKIVLKYLKQKKNSNSRPTRIHP